MTTNNKNQIENWQNSRSGAWAGRGFHYQHLFSTLILVRQWSGLAPAGFLVPEGLDDCVIELVDYELWIQIKSRKEGKFNETEVQKFISTINSKAATSKSDKEIRTALALEQPCPGQPYNSLDQLFDRQNSQILSFNAPEVEIISLLTAHLNIAEVIADGIMSDLYRLVAEASEANASLPFEKRRRISTTEVERRIFERLEAGDPSVIENALSSGSLQPVDFVNPVNEVSFYQGVKVVPGHVASGLVLSRPDEIKDITYALKQRRHVLISGPSGAGKSALMWLSANALSGEFRWYQITGQAVAADADSIIRFVRARHPNDASPIGLAFDEVCSSNSDLWDVLVRELRGLPSVYFLGSVRQEDRNLIINHSDVEFITVTLSEDLAKTVWEKLTIDKLTNWAHWREPFEQSKGLMLEYVHLLTQGKRLGEVIEEQVRQREKECRSDELAIIRSTASLCAYGGEINANKLFELLEISPEIASVALKRLVDEHLVRESKPGVLGGLHALRSEALRKASHDETVFLSANTLWQGLTTVTKETLPRVIQSILSDAPEETKSTALEHLAKILGKCDDIEVWASILTGLGLATLERHVTSFTLILEKHGVQRAQWSLASMFAVSNADLPDLKEFEKWDSLQNAVLEFRALPKHDLRTACLKLILKEGEMPPCSNLQQANQLLSCLAPICGGDPVQIVLNTEFTGDGEQDIKQVSDLLSTAYLIDPEISRTLTEALGGEETLLTWFYSQTPWVEMPEIVSDGAHGRTIRSNWFYVAEQYQQDPHEAICNICETLIAISPNSEAAASDAVNPLGQAITVNGYTPWSKNMPRENIHAKTKIAWNVAFRQILFARSAADSLTDYTWKMASLVKRTEKVFRNFTEKWIKGKSISNADSLAAEINEIIEEVNALAYATPEKPASTMTAPAEDTGKDDSLGALLTGVLGNLAGRLGKVHEEGGKAVATFSGMLADQALEHEKSEIWRTISSPPKEELSSLSKRLGDVACIAHEMSFDGDPNTIQKIVKVAKKGSLNRAINTAARHCRSLADKRFADKMRAVENALKEKDWSTQCWSRPICEKDSIYWPAAEVTILTEIEDFETDGDYLEDSLEAGQQHFGNDWRFRVAPVINGHVLGSFALISSSQMPLPDQDFAQDWSEHIDLPFLSGERAELFNETITACTYLSAIIACRDLERLHPKEDAVFSKAIESFNEKKGRLVELCDGTEIEIFTVALDYIDETWNQVVSELEDTKAQKNITERLCMTPYLAMSGQENEKTAELTTIHALLLQAECLYLCKKTMKV